MEYFKTCHLVTDESSYSNSFESVILYCAGMKKQTEFKKTIFKIKRKMPKYTIKIKMIVYLCRIVWVIWWFLITEKEYVLV